MAKVLVADALSDVGVALLREAGLEVDVNTGRSEEELLKIVGSYDAMIVRSATKVTARVIEAATQLKVVGRAGVGVDNVDVAAASRKGVIVMNTPLGNVTSAAEHAVAMLMTMARNIPGADASMKAGKWDKKSFTGVEVCEKTLGIIGMGKVGQIVAKAGIGLNMKVLAYDPFLPERRARELGVEPAALDDVLAKSDFITIHTPLTDQTRGLLNEAGLAKIKKGARLVNCARGGIVDEAALVKALEEGRLAGAAVDVFGVEPLAADSPLRKAPHIILTPHLGASTEEAQTKVAEAIAQQIAAFFKEGKIQYAVNLSVTLTREMEPFAELARALGKLLSQMLPNPPQKLTTAAEGRIATEDTHALSVFALQGLLASWHDRLNVVNAPLVAEERGIAIVEQKSFESRDYANLVRLTVETAKTTHTVAGTVFEGREPRITEIDGFSVDLKPEGTMLVLFYADRPGMVGKFGTILGDAKINIAGMDVGRKEKRGRACIALSVDDPVPPDVVEKMRACTGTGETYLVSFA